MADHVTLKFKPEIAGEETVENHEGQIELLSFQMGGGRSLDSSMLKGDSVPSNVDIQMSFSKSADKSSAPLWDAFLTGKRFDEAVIHVLRNTKDGGNDVSFELTLQKVVIGSFSYSAMQGDSSRGNESFTLVAASMKGRADKMDFSWDFLVNKKV